MTRDITTIVDLDTVRRNADRIARHVNVPMIAVVKADAYGLGVERVVRTISDIVAGFCVLHLREAAEINLHHIARKPILCLCPQSNETANDFLAAGVNPAVWNVEMARALRSATPALSVDTGMQRLACPANQTENVLREGQCDQAFTHATRIEHVEILTSLLGNRGIRLHAAGSSLLDDPRGWLDAVRPGMAIYRGALRVSTHLVEARDGKGPAGYTGFIVPRHGVIPIGYRDGLRVGPCSVNGKPRKILEVGMQTAFVELEKKDKTGDEVILIGDGLTEIQIASVWNCSPQEVLVRFAAMGR